ncbi:hypothetical protein GCM10028827_25760 [Mucilaginibacter myungsuensis]
MFKKLSPHDQYGQRLIEAGLHKTALGNSWLSKANESVVKTLNITIPYQETGYFASDKIMATALKFDAKRGQMLRVAIRRKPILNFAIYADLMQVEENNETKVVASADTLGADINYEVKQTGKYILRLQPELLRGGEYTLTITAGPSLGFPVSNVGKPRIGSFWGDGRDADSRKHEGVDIFATKGSPAIATDPGTVNRVGENNLGGKVVFFRPEGRDYSLYYAHLDSQLVSDGQTLKAGDVIGLVGNTGNARTTPAHLHFGIYTNQGAVDPLPFIDRNIKQPLPVTAPLTNLNATVRNNSKSTIYTLPDPKSTGSPLSQHTPLTVDAATDGWYKVALPDGTAGFVRAKETASISPIRNLALKTDSPLYDKPDSTAAHKLTIDKGDKVDILGTYKNYFLVEYKDTTGWISSSR